MNWKHNNVSHMWEPTEYPSPIDVSSLVLPTTISNTFYKLNSLIETKYAKEYIKMCAFYNKMFPSLKSFDWGRSTHNSAPFTLQEQERFDGSTGISENYLKSAIDKITARIANLRYELIIQAGIPNLKYEMYREPVEKYLKKCLKSSKLPKLTTEVFHDAAILGFGHLFINPWTNTVMKVNDWELGCFESEFNIGKLSRILIRDFAFPVTQLSPYLVGLDKEQIKNIIAEKAQVDLKLYIDAIRKEAYATIDTYTLDPIPYPLDYVQLITFAWDIGVKRTMVTSLFDMLYPIQRSINKLNAKKTQLIENYKGPVPVFNNDCDVVVKSMGNGAGEALFLAAGRTAAEMISVINPTPLDPEMNAEKEMSKTALQELAGAQELSLDMENIRSAATVIALEQLHDQKFQSQLTMLSDFISEVFEQLLRYEIAYAQDIDYVPYESVREMLDDCSIVVTAIKNNNEVSAPIAEETDYITALVNDAVIKVMLGKLEWSQLSNDFTIDAMMIRQALAKMYMRVKLIGGDGLDNLQRALVGAFTDDIIVGAVTL